ncbi:hypothetical protein BJ322DRAFT_1068401 [Thelephora terrestris]|uniref:Uncharacterized protein n=1 Tax=Thelephora terrestris TaxID=56493 RepID=A0A9P6L6B6_9AGAM|nr:hypothetical protein BJ322DRAFT_1068401 [Thelephora terrestris]
MSDPRGKRVMFMSMSALPAHRDQSFEELRIADYIKAYTTTGRPPAPVSQEPVDPAARATLDLPLLFQPHVDLEKTSGNGASTEQTTSSSQVNGVSQSQDSEAAGLEAITAEEPFRGYSFEELRCFAYANNVTRLPQIHFGRLGFRGYCGFFDRVFQEYTLPTVLMCFRL